MLKYFMTKKKLNFQKRNLLVVLLMVLIVVIGTLYFHKNNSNQNLVTPTPMISTADWKTYQDPKNSYSFKYPSDWTYSVIGTAHPIIKFAFLSNGTQYSMSLNVLGTEGPQADKTADEYV